MDKNTAGRISRLLRVPGRENIGTLLDETSDVDP
jgi:hypothetical protein